MSEQITHILLVEDNDGHAEQNIVERKRAKKDGERVLEKENASMAEIGDIVGLPLSTEDVYKRFTEAVRSLVPFRRERTD